MSYFWPPVKLSNSLKPLSPFFLAPGWHLFKRTGGESKPCKQTGLIVFDPNKEEQVENCCLLTAQSRMLIRLCEIKANMCIHIAPNQNLHMSSVRV